MVSEIRSSDNRSLTQILVWLKQEHDDDDGEEFGGFYGNRGIIREAHEEGALTVMVDSGEVVGFFVGDEMSWDILEIRPDMRGRGYGRTLAQHYIKQARRSDVCVLDIECSPWSSIPFWKGMGFTMFPINEEMQNRAYMVFDKSFVLPNHFPAVSVFLTFFPESKKWDHQTEPVIALAREAVQVNANEILLSDRVICFDPSNRLRHDPVVSVEVDGNTIYLDKVKYDGAKKIGFKRDDRGTYYLDHLILS